jgi:hypothetical protein
MIPSATALKLLYIGSGRFDSLSSVAAMTASLMGLSKFW